jgi:hypothetical protein
MTVSAKAGSEGNASMNINSVDIIGEGSSLGSNTTGAKYTLNAVPVASPQNLTPQPTKEKTVANEEQLKEEKTVEVANVVDMGAAALAETSTTQLFFGWIWSNIIWIVVLLTLTTCAYVAGRLKCVKLWEKHKTQNRVNR